MLVMFALFGLYFLYDWKIGYPEKNIVVAHYKAFEEAEEAWTDPEKREQWAAFSADKKIPFDEDRSIYPSGTNFDQDWPEGLKDAEAMENLKLAGLWKDHSEERGWPQKVDTLEDAKPADKIFEQLVSAGICALLAGTAAFFLLRTRKRSMRVDGEAFYSVEGARIPFSAIRVIDKRKWDTKGLATLTYENDNGQRKKTKVDGMVYGQFKEEDGAPAEKLFQRILQNFNGELIELAEEDLEESPVASENGKQEGGAQDS